MKSLLLVKQICFKLENSFFYIYIKDNKIEFFLDLIDNIIFKYNYIVFEIMKLNMVLYSYNY